MILIATKFSVTSIVSSKKLAHENHISGCSLKIVILDTGIRTRFTILISSSNIVLIQNHLQASSHIEISIPLPISLKESLSSNGAT